MRSRHIALVWLALSACAHLPWATAPARTDYERTLSDARKYVESGNYLVADRLLNEFARRHPETREAREIQFWKAVYMVDPANGRGSLAGGIAALEGYLAADSAGWYRYEATVLRRTALAAQATSAHASATPASPAAGSSPTRDTVIVIRSREQEIASLRDQLAKSKEELGKVTAELERIKKRLANPSN